MSSTIVNIVVAGLGGQGVVKASDILSDAAFRAGHDVKKSEIHGMSQRGGSVSSDVRYGAKVESPMVPAGEADFLVVVDETQIEPNRHMLRPNGLLITPKTLGVLGENGNGGPLPKSLNVMLLGALSAHLELSEDCWTEAIRANLPKATHEENVAAFLEMRRTEKKG